MGFFDGLFQGSSGPVSRITTRRRLPEEFLHCPPAPPEDPLESLKKMKETFRKVKTIVATDSKLEGGKIGLKRAAAEYATILAELEKQQKELVAHWEESNKNSEEAAKAQIQKLAELEAKRDALKKDGSELEQKIKQGQQAGGGLPTSAPQGFTHHHGLESSFLIDWLYTA